LSLPTLIARYALFAVLATLVNLAAQRLILAGGTETPRYAAAVFAGTLAGLVLKYLLDKRWIFYDTGAGVRQHGTKFALYSAMGIVTTIIFWGMETAFWLIWRHDALRELGAVIGLAIGYVVKYHLDRRFVFTDAVLGSARR
jgi:putative flippase GtrA